MMRTCIKVASVGVFGITGVMVGSQFKPQPVMNTYHSIDNKFHRDPVAWVNFENGGLVPMHVTAFYPLVNGKRVDSLLENKENKLYIVSSESTGLYEIDKRNIGMWVGAHRGPIITARPTEITKDKKWLESFQYDLKNVKFVVHCTSGQPGTFVGWLLSRKLEITID